MKSIIYTVAALCAFAANSVLCRLALVEGYIDPWHFTIIRLLGGAVCLIIIMMLRHHFLQPSDAVFKDKGSWLSSLGLVIYALCFSLAYVELDTGTGALILFAAVQFTMIGWGIYNKERLSVRQWMALFIAVIGFVYVMLPSASVPSVFGAGMMTISGVAWGLYSIRGKVCVSPLQATGFNFIRSLVALPLLLWIGSRYLAEITMTGVILAGISGAVTSGIGYSLWYVAMPLLKSTQAAIVQLCVPILAAMMGLLFLSEPITLPFIIASAVILGAVAVFVSHKVQP